MIGFPFDNDSETDTSKNVGSDKLAMLFKLILASNGIIPVIGNEFSVDSVNGMNVTILGGWGAVEGHIFEEKNNTTLAFQASESLDRIDKIVIRLDMDKKDINLHVVKGTAGTTPSAESLVRTPEKFELGIANVLIPKGSTEVLQENITDLRLNSEQCGIIAKLGTVDFSSIFNQTESIFEKYYELFSSAIDKTTAGKLQNNIDEINTIVPTGFKKTLNANELKTGGVFTVNGDSQNLPSDGYSGLLVVKIIDGEIYQEFTQNASNAKSYALNPAPILYKRRFMKESQKWSEWLQQAFFSHSPAETESDGYISLMNYVDENDKTKGKYLGFGQKVSSFAQTSSGEFVPKLVLRKASTETFEGSTNVVPVEGTEIKTIVSEGYWTRSGQVVNLWIKIDVRILSSRQDYPHIGVSLPFLSSRYMGKQVLPAYRFGAGYITKLDPYILKRNAHIGFIGNNNPLTTGDIDPNYTSNFALETNFTYSID